LAKDWEQNGAQVIAILRVSDPKTYSTLIASMAPKLVEMSNPGTEFQSMSEAELENYLAESFSTNLAQGERIMAKARALAAARLGNGPDDADPVVQIINDMPKPAA